MVSNNAGSHHALLSQLLDDHTSTNPSDIFAVFPEDSSLKKLHNLTFRDMTGAVNRMCRWIERHVGLGKTAESAKRTVVGYVGSVAFFLNIATLD